MDRLTFAIAAGAVTTIMMLAFLTLTDNVDAQTPPRQAIIFDGSITTSCGSGSDRTYNLLFDTSSRYYYENHDSIWKSWTDDDVIHFYDGGLLHLLGGAIDRNTDVYTVKGLMNTNCQTSKITIQGHCDGSWTTMIVGNETSRLTPADDWRAACYGN